MYMFVLLFDALEIPLWSEMEKATDGVRLLAGCSHFLLWCWWCAAVVVVAKNSVVGFLGEKCNFLRKKLVHPSGKGLGGLGERFCWKIFCADFSIFSISDCCMGRRIYKLFQVYKLMPFLHLLLLFPLLVNTGLIIFMQKNSLKYHKIFMLPMFLYVEVYHRPKGNCKMLNLSE